jgi:hypothetical protein
MWIYIGLKSQLMNGVPLSYSNYFIIKLAGEYHTKSSDGQISFRSDSWIGKTVNEIIYEPYNLIVDENKLVIFVP